MREAFAHRYPIEVGVRSGTLLVGKPPAVSVKTPVQSDQQQKNNGAAEAAGSKGANDRGDEVGNEGGGEGGVVIVTAGTSDLGVAEEAAMTCRALGFAVRAINDVGVAGIHRVLDRAAELRSADCVVVVAGMEGALPSVVGGLVDVPVIAVPTSVGYGASFGGLSALLGMLNSCASGVTVVNIDNGFGAAYAACQIVRLVQRRQVQAEG